MAALKVLRGIVFRGGNKLIESLGRYNEAEKPLISCQVGDQRAVFAFTSSASTYTLMRSVYLDVDF